MFVAPRRSSLLLISYVALLTTFSSLFLMSETHTAVEAFVARGSSSSRNSLRTTLPFSSSSASSSTRMTALQAEAKKTKKADIPAIRKKEFVSMMAEELGYTKLDAELALTKALDLIAEVRGQPWSCNSNIL